MPELKQTRSLWTVITGGLHGLDAYLYTVTGEGPFPVDLLRAECAWPATGTDAAAIIASVEWRGAPLTVHLKGIRAPVPPRWHAQGWRLVLDAAHPLDVEYAGS